MSNMTAALSNAFAKFAIPALVFAGAMTAVQAPSAAQGIQESVTVAMRITPPARTSHVEPASTTNVTVVPKTPTQDAEVKAFELSADMREEIEGTVRDQLHALAKGDANMAFANLAPQTQRFFSEPQRFMRSVATDATPIVKTKSFTFVGIEQDSGAAEQQVLLTDEDGRSWLAKFQLEQQLTGDWRVKSCVVEAAPGQQA